MVDEILKFAVDVIADTRETVDKDHMYVVAHGLYRALRTAIRLQCNDLGTVILNMFIEHNTLVHSLRMGIGSKLLGSCIKNGNVDFYFPGFILRREERWSRSETSTKDLITEHNVASMFQERGCSRFFLAQLVNRGHLDVDYVGLMAISLRLAVDANDMILRTSCSDLELQ